MPQKQIENITQDQSLEKTVTQLIVSTLNRKPDAIKASDPLFSTQDGFDSFSLMEFVLQLEETYNLSIPDDDLDLEIFYSVETIVAYLQSRLEQS